MKKIDELPKELREAVHDLGWLVVKSFIEVGVTEAKLMRRLVQIIRDNDKPAWLRGPWNDDGKAKEAPAKQP